MTNRVLGVFEKWVDCNPAFGPSPQASFFMGSLESLGVTEVDRFYYDETALAHGGSADGSLLQRVVADPPDLLVYSPAANSPYLPAVQTLTTIRQKYGVKIAAIFPDIAIVERAQYADAIYDSIELAITIDSAPERVRVPRRDKFIHLWTPQDPRLFHPGPGPRDIEVSFLGTLENYPDREAALAHLKANGIGVHVAGGMRQAAIPLEEYADILRRSRIALNFSQFFGGHPFHNVKGRVFEILYSGAMLLEPVNPHMPAFFTAGRDYVAWDGLDDLLTKVRHYLADDTARDAIAAAGHARATGEYSAARFWTAVFSRLAA